MDVAALAVSGAAVIVTGIVSHAFHAWLAQRERERLSATDKAQLVTRLDGIDTRLLDLKNNLPPRRG